jgi:hypothetical protein
MSATKRKHEYETNEESQQVTTKTTELSLVKLRDVRDQVRLYINRRCYNMTPT